MSWFDKLIERVFPKATAHIRKVREAKKRHSEEIRKAIKVWKKADSGREFDEEAAEAAEALFPKPRVKVKCIDGVWHRMGWDSKLISVKSGLHTYEPKVKWVEIQNLCKVSPDGYEWV